MRIARKAFVVAALLSCWPLVARAQSGPGWDYVLNNPFTLMGRARGHPDTFDAATYAAANYTALFNSEANVSILPEGEAQGLPWHHHVQASQSGANNDFGGLNQKLMDDTWAAYNAAPNSAVGWHIWDEPRGYHINQGYVRETFDWVRANFPDQLAYTVTIGPFAEQVDYWGGPNMPAGGYTFEDYQDDLVNLVEPDLLLYDTYIFAESGGTSNPILGPKKISDAAKAAGIPYWGYVQSFGRQAIARRVPSESDVRLHVFSHLAYGFSGIIYFTYEPSQGPAQIDEQGNPEQLYYDVQALNPEAFNLGERIKTLSHRESFWVNNADSTETPYAISSWQTFQGTANADPRIKDISPDYSKPGNQGNKKDALLSVFRDESSDTRYFMVNNMYNGATMTAADAELDYYVQFDWTVDHVYRIDRHTGQEVLVPLTNNRLELTLPGGTADLFRHGTYAEPDVTNTHFAEDFESGYSPGSLLSNQNGWTVSMGNPILPIGADDPNDNFNGQFIDGPASGEGFTIYENAAGIGGGLDPNEVTVLTWNWELNSQSHAQRLGFLGSGPGAGNVKQAEWAALDDLGIARFEIQSDDLPGGEIQYDVPVDFASGEAVEFKLVVDGVENFIYGIADGAETDRIPLTDQLIADIQGLRLTVVNEPNRRYPKLDDILLVSGVPPAAIVVPGQTVWNPQTSGDWNVATNWIGGTAANSADESAVFRGTSSSTNTVFTNTDVTVNDVQFDSPGTYVVAGGGTVELTSGNLSGQPTSGISVLQGSHQFQAVVELNNDVMVEVANGASLELVNRLNLNGNTLTKNGSGELVISNALNTGGGTVICQTGICSGSGNVGGDLNNSGGTVSPGSSPGILAADNYSQGELASLLIELSGTEPGVSHDVLDVAGLAELDGTLVVALLDEFSPANGDRFEILKFASSTGRFAEVRLPALASGLAWDMTDLYTAGSVSIVPEPSSLLLASIFFGCLLMHCSIAGPTNLPRRLT